MNICTTFILLKLLKQRHILHMNAMMQPVSTEFTELDLIEYAFSSLIWTVSGSPINP